MLPQVPGKALLSTLTALLLGPGLPGGYTPAVAWPLAGSLFSILCDALRQAESRKRKKGEGSYSAPSPKPMAKDTGTKSSLHSGQ